MYQRRRIMKTFVISVKNIDGGWDYYNIDSHSGGYPYWAPYGGAEFASIEDAEKRIAADKQHGIWKSMLDEKHDIRTLAIKELVYVTVKKLSQYTEEVKNVE